MKKKRCFPDNTKTDQRRSRVLWKAGRYPTASDNRIHYSYWKGLAPMKPINTEKGKPKNTGSQPRTLEAYRFGVSVRE